MQRPDRFQNLTGNRDHIDSETLQVTETGQIPKPYRYQRPDRFQSHAGKKKDWTDSKTLQVTETRQAKALELAHTK
jgi:hypothetical protein